MSGLKLGWFVAGALALARLGDAGEEPVEGWESNLTDAVARAEAEQKLLLQFRLIGRFERPDC